MPNCWIKTKKKKKGKKKHKRTYKLCNHHFWPIFSQDWNVNQNPFRPTKSADDLPFSFLSHYKIYWLLNWAFENYLHAALSWFEFFDKSSLNSFHNCKGFNLGINHWGEIAICRSSNAQYQIQKVVGSSFCSHHTFKGGSRRSFWSIMWFV